MAACTRQYDATRKSRWSVKACSDSGHHFYRVEKLPAQSCAVNHPLRRDPVVTSMVTSSGYLCRHPHSTQEIPTKGDPLPGLSVPHFIGRQSVSALSVLTVEAQAMDTSLVTMPWLPSWLTHW